MGCYPEYIRLKSPGYVGISISWTDLPFPLDLPTKVRSKYFVLSRAPFVPILDVPSTKYFSLLRLVTNFFPKGSFQSVGRFESLVGNEDVKSLPGSCILLELSF